MTPHPRATESQCQATIVAAALLAGWMVHAERPAQHQSGRWGTPIQGNPGFPDLVLLHPYHRLLWFVELKRKPNKVEPAQQRWHDALGLLDVEGQGVPWVQTSVVWVPEQMDAFIAELVAPLGRLEAS